MCLAVPMKVKNIRWPIAEVSAQGLIKDVDICDYVIVHAGFVIQIMDKELERESLEIWEALEF